MAIGLPRQSRVFREAMVAMDTFNAEYIRSGEINTPANTASAAQMIKRSMCAHFVEAVRACIRRLEAITFT